MSQLTQEAKIKYDLSMGQAKVNYLALNKKSQQKLENSYFKDETSNEKMDNLMERL